MTKKEENSQMILLRRSSWLLKKMERMMVKFVKTWDMNNKIAKNLMMSIKEI